MGLKKLFGYDVRDVWRQVAQDIGAGYDAGKEVVLQRPKITLEVGGGVVVADIQSPGVAGVQDDETWVRTKLETFQPFTFEIRDRTIWASARRLFGARSPSTGCPYLDRHFEARASDEQRMRDILSRQAICSLLEGHRHMVELAILAADEHRPYHVLRYRELGHIRDGRRLKRILLLFVELLSVVEDSSVRTDGLAGRWGIA